jgi:hypothetical protein
MTLTPPAIQKQQWHSREKLRLNFHSLSVSVSELLEYMRKKLRNVGVDCLYIAIVLLFLPRSLNIVFRNLYTLWASCTNASTRQQPLAYQSGTKVSSEFINSKCPCLYFQGSYTKTSSRVGFNDTVRLCWVGEYKIFGSGKRYITSNFMSVASRRWN